LIENITVDHQTIAGDKRRFGPVPVLKNQRRCPQLPFLADNYLWPDSAADHHRIGGFQQRCRSPCQQFAPTRCENQVKYKAHGQEKVSHALVSVKEILPTNGGEWPRPAC
jgi:hypothetical protein